MIDQTDKTPSFLTCVFEGITWTLKTTWAHFNGRFYVFRDAPTWFVRLWAASDTSDPNDTDFVAEAQRELELRRMRIERQRGVSK